MNRRITRLIQVSGGLLGLMALSVCAWPRERQLFSQATRTSFSTRGCVAGRRTFTPEYFWQSPANALCFKLDAREQVYAISVDVATGKQIPLTRLNALLTGTLECGWMRCVTSTKPHRVFSQPYMENVSLSPDGKRLLWLQSSRFSPQGRRSLPQWMVATLDGRETHHWDARNYSALNTRAFWSPDSRYCFVRAFAGKGLFTQRVDVDTGRHREVSIPIPAQYETLKDIFPAQFRSVLAHEELLFMPDVAWNKVVTQVPLCALNLQGAIRRWTLRLPFPAQVREMKLSPQGGRFALWLHYDSMQPGFPLLQRVWKALGMKNIPVEGLWICNVDGSDLREVGHIPCPPETVPTTANNLPDGLNWLPGEERLSFCYRDALWTTPAR